MSIEFKSSNGNLNITPNVFSSLPVCSEVATLDNQLVNKKFVIDNKTPINKINLSSCTVPRSGNNSATVDLSLNSINCLTNDLEYNYSSLPSSVNNNVKFMQVDSQKNIYIGVEASSGNCLFKLNTTTYSLTSVGNLTGNIRSIAIDNLDNVYVTGEFSDYTSVVKWNGINWSNVGDINITHLVPYSSSYRYYILKIAVDSQGNVYIIKGLRSDWVTLHYLVEKYDGIQWTELAKTEANFTSIVIDSLNNVYIGGNFGFIVVDGVRVNIEYMAKWNGSNWRSPSTNNTNFVDIMKIDENDNIYMVTTSSYITVYSGGKYNRYSFDGAGTGSGSQIRDIEIDQYGDVYVVGQFTTIIVDNVLKPANYLAKFENGKIISYVKNIQSPLSSILLVNNILFIGGTTTSFQSVTGGVAKVELELSHSLYNKNNNFITNIKKNQSIVLNITSDSKHYVQYEQQYIDNQFATEETARLAADTALQTRIATEESARSAADTALQTRIATEETARSDADTALQTRIATEESARSAADTALQTRIATEESARADADTYLHTMIATRIATEETARSAADTALQTMIASLQTRIATEETARSDADTDLQSRIATEVSARSEADTYLHTMIATRIATEETARSAADTALQSRISTLETALAGLVTRVTQLENP